MEFGSSFVVFTLFFRFLGVVRGIRFVLEGFSRLERLFVIGRDSLWY